MLARRIIVISVAVAVACGYAHWILHLEGFLIPCAVALGLAILSYVMQYQINEFWHRRFPPRLPEPVVGLYLTASGFYTGLDEETKQRFDERAALFVEDKEFIPQGLDNLAEDIKYMVAFYAALITINQDEFLFKGYDRIVFYLHPFLSPHFPSDVHVYEVEHGDGTVILTVEHVTASFMDPERYYATALHAIAEMYAMLYLSEKPAFGKDIWQTLEKISNVSREKLEEYLGMAQVDPWPVAVHHWYVHRTKFKTVAPELAKQLGDLLG